MEIGLFFLLLSFDKIPYNPIIRSDVDKYSTLIRNKKIRRLNVTDSKPWLKPSNLLTTLDIFYTYPDCLDSTCSKILIINF